MRGLFGAVAACIVLAIVLGITTSSDFGTAAAITLGGTAFVLLISGAFYAVGRSEDRDRDRGRDEH